MSKGQIITDESISNVKTLLEAFSKKVTLVEAYKAPLASLIKKCEETNSSWSGSFLGYHSRYYYKNFEVPPADEQFDSEWGGINGIPEEWRSYNNEEVSTHIYDGINDFTYEAARETIESVIESADELKRSVESEFSILSNNPNEWGTELDLLKKISELELRFSPSDFLRSWQPRNMISRDTKAMFQGIKTPAHLQLQAEFISSDLTIGAFRNLINLVKQLLRQLEVKLNYIAQPESLRKGIEDLKLILCNFNKAVRQLSQRHDGRSTVEINDEYDVQDILRFTLHLLFKDVRPEEWNPSYAGGATRSDFLIKDIQTVVEVKKTSNTLKDKKLGEELLIDIGRYKSNPECKNLICFIYDSDAKIANPEGLIKDLEAQSTDSMNVLVVINPV